MVEITDVFELGKKIGEIEFRPHTFDTEPTTFIFNVWLLLDGSYQALMEVHPKGAMNFQGRWYGLGEMFGIMKIFKNGKIISNTLPENIMKRARKEAILMKLE